MNLRNAALILSAVVASAALARGEDTNAAAPATSCRACHVADRPMRGNSALQPCTRVEPRGTHSPDEGPDVVTMSEGTGHYARVVFSHRIHAEMSDMGAGCGDCHHEAIEGQKLRKCDECHSPERARKELEAPDLRGAIHRQCVNCHKKWEPRTRCKSCHHEEPVGVRPVAATEHVRAIYRVHHGVKCAQCHADRQPGEKLERACTFCHDDLAESFDHRKVGLELDKDHKDATCEDCHGDLTFSGPPVCADCHDDVKYPQDLPGKKVPAPQGESAKP